MKQALVAISLVLSASAVGASSYWESNISNNDLNWDYGNNQFAYETWLEEVDGNPSSWQTSKLNYINNNYLLTDEGTAINIQTTTDYFAINNTLYSNEATGIKNYNTSDVVNYNLLPENIKNDVIAAHDEGWTGNTFIYPYFSQYRATTKTLDILKTIAPNSNPSIGIGSSTSSYKNYAIVWNIKQQTEGGVSSTDSKILISPPISYYNNQDTARKIIVNKDLKVHTPPIQSNGSQGTYASRIADKGAIIAGAATLVWTKFNDLSNITVKNILIGTADNKYLNLNAALSPVGNLN